MITKIGEAIALVLTAWNPANNIVDNVCNVIAELAKAAGGTGILGNALVQDALKAEATVKAIESGDVGILGVVDVGGKKIAVFAIDNSSILASKLFGTGSTVS